MSEPRVTQEQLDLMRHTVGLDNSDTAYRNYYASNGNNLVMDDLVNMGLMKTSKQPALSDYLYYHLTDEGCYMLNINGTKAIS